MCVDEAIPIPTSLLARGDTFLLWPGQESPAKADCKLVNHSVLIFLQILYIIHMLYVFVVKDQCCTLEVGQVFESAMTKQCMFHDDNDEVTDHK